MTTNVRDVISVSTGHLDFAFVQVEAGVVLGHLGCRQYLFGRFDGADAAPPFGAADAAAASDQSALSRSQVLSGA